MASRENQGLHIALILLIMLTVGLCVISYVFYSASERRRGEAEDARNQLAQAQKDLATANFKVQTLTYMVNGGSKTMAQIEADLANITSAGGGADDPVTQQIVKNFKDNMLLYGAPDQESEAARNYESLPSFLLARVRDLNQQLADLRRNENALNTQKAQLEQTAAERSQKFEDAANQARADLDAERQKFQSDLGEVRKQMEGIAAQVAEKDNRIVELTEQMTQQQEAASKKIADMEKAILDIKIQRQQEEKPSFETPDAIVTSVNQKAGVVYLNVGSADNLKPQQTFSIFNKGTTAVMQAAPKARIEVTQVVSEHVSVCRILEDQVANIIVPGDLAFTPAWSPGQQIHFAIAGFIDLTNDDKSDLEMLKNLIRVNGGVVDDEVTVQTRYLIQGTDKGSGPDGTFSDAERSAFNAMITAATEIGVDRLSTDKLLSLMGWKADVKSVVLGSGTVADATAEQPEQAPTTDAASAEAAGPEFRKRTPPARGEDGAF